MTTSRSCQALRVLERHDRMAGAGRMAIMRAGDAYALECSRSNSAQASVYAEPVSCPTSPYHT